MGCQRWILAARVTQPIASKARAKKAEYSYGYRYGNYRRGGWTRLSKIGGGNTSVGRGEEKKNLSKIRRFGIAKKPKAQCQAQPLQTLSQTLQDLQQSRDDPCSDPKGFLPRLRLHVCTVPLVHHTASNCLGDGDSCISRSSCPFTSGGHVRHVRVCEALWMMRLPSD